MLFPPPRSGNRPLQPLKWRQRKRHTQSAPSRRRGEGATERPPRSAAAHLPCEAKPSIHEGLIDERLEHLAVIGAYRARRLCHVHRHDLLLGINPEIGAGITTPNESARGPRHTSDPIALTHRKAEAERIA